MKIASSPMAAIEALQLDVAYVRPAARPAVPVVHGPVHAKILDAQAGAETFGSALLAALAGVNSVSGPGMLDFLLVLQPAEAGLRRRDVRPGAALRARVPARGRSSDTGPDRPADGRPAPDHGPATTAHWPRRSTCERDRRARQRENWTKAGAQDTYQRAVDETNRRLAAYRQVETDRAIVAELERIIHSGLTEQTDLPVIPPPPDASEPIATGPPVGPTPGASATGGPSA